MRIRPLLGVATAMAAMAAMVGCGPPARIDDGRLHVVASFYPLQFVAEQVGGDRVAVANLVKPGAEPHDLELNPWQVVDIAGADLVLYLRHFQPAVDEAVDQEAQHHALDVSTAIPLLSATESDGHKDIAADPHVWLDPSRLAEIAAATADRFSAIDPASASGYHARANALGSQLATLDREYQAGLATCVRRDIVTSHAAFGYLAQRYGLHQVAITGVTPEDEPTPKRLRDAVDLARRTSATTIFFETLVSAKVAQTVAKEIGARAEVLDPIEGIEGPSTDTYFSLMRANLATIRSALGCS